MSEIVRQATESLSQQLREYAESKRLDDPPAALLDKLSIQATRRTITSHIAKMVHPATKASSLFIKPSALPPTDALGTHALNDNSLPKDTEGDAATLSVHKLLVDCEAGGRSFLERLVDNPDDPTVAGAIRAIAGDAAPSILDRLRGMARPVPPARTDQYLKQVLWPVTGGHDEEDYVVLSTLKPASLEQAIQNALAEERFSEAAKAAREARKARRHHPRPIKHFPRLCTIQVGGANAQNVSYGNAKRRGRNTLFPALPPTWRPTDLRPLLGVSSAFKVFGRRPSVKRCLDTLAGALKSRKNTVGIRRRRDLAVREIIDELLWFAEAHRSLPSGWSRDSQCQLPTHERIWLDPDSYEEGRRPSIDRLLDEPGPMSVPVWAAELADHFALWLNQSLKLEKIATSDSSHDHWRKLLERETRGLREVLS